MEQYFTCPDDVGTLVDAKVWVVGALILKNAIARKTQAMSCTNPPGTATINRVFRDAEPEEASTANTIPSTIVREAPASNILAAFLNKGTSDLVASKLIALTVNTTLIKETMPITAKKGAK